MYLPTKPINNPQPMQYTQILTAVSPNTAHITFPFPYTFGQYGVLRSWVQTGNNNSKVQRRTNFKQHLWSTLGEILDNNTCNWHAPKCKLVADITLLYTDNHPYSKLVGLPQSLSLNFEDATISKILHFIAPLHYPPPPQELIPALILPIRYFNTIQRHLITKQLLLLGESPHNIASILWSTPQPGTQAHTDLQSADHNLGHLQINEKLDKQLSKAQATAFAASPEGRRAAFFKLFTRGTFAFERPNDPGWPDPTSLIARELQTLDEYGRNHPTTIERHAKWELVFAHWDNLQYLSTHHLFQPAEIDYLTALLEQVTNPSQTTPNPTPQTTTTPHDNHTANTPTETPTETVGLDAP